MSTLRDKIRNGEPLPLPIDAALTAASAVQRAGMWWRGRQRPQRVGARVVSYGNLTAGGTGKTPAVIERARAEAAAGHRVAVVTRGYASRRTPEPFLVRPGEPVERLWEQLGDEPALIRRRVPEVVLVKSANRAAGARAAILRAQCDTILLDDGFQALGLARDEDWVCIDAVNPFGNRRIVPRGLLREPVAALARATGIVLTRCDQATRLDALIDELHALCPDTPLRLTHHQPTGLWRVCDGAPAPLSMLDGAEVAAACAIAHPEAFCRTLAGLGARIGARSFYPDHAPIPLRGLPAHGAVVVTEKDAVRMESPPGNVYALQIELADFDLPSAAPCAS